MSLITCAGCGGRFPETDGPTHRYMESSPGCWACFGEVLAREYSDLQYQKVHRLRVNHSLIAHCSSPTLAGRHRDTTMRFCTAINCMDGRAQIPVIGYLQERFKAEYVDMVTETGANGVLAPGQDAAAVVSMKRRVRISVEKHQSGGLAVVGHHDCAGNPVSDIQQNADTMLAVDFIREAFPQIPVIGLWLNERGDVEELPEATAKSSMGLDEE